MSQDIEAEPTRRWTRREERGGYTAAASWLVRDTDSETLVFRKFNTLAALNILYLQSEVLELEEEIAQMHRDTENTRDMDLKNAARKWEALVEQSTEDGPEFRTEAKSQMELIRRVRVVIKEYRKWATHCSMQVLSLTIPRLINVHGQTRP